ncbi:unnamed protein product [Dracunculus medinensis]|uniref:Choline kinase n=1 Tax=Dracunculus medinensis TaxID=318479 RepID=A0A0N4U4Z0_DRAME|nr:unnamed protein product [Dracunculus medinensis]
MFLVRLANETKPFGNEPTSVLLRIYSDPKNNDLMNESIICTIFSERKIGPKLLGIFRGGRFEEYIPSRSLSRQELSSPLYMDLNLLNSRITCYIGRLLAQVHSLNVPVKKEPLLIERAYIWLKNLHKQMIHKMQTTKVSVDLSQVGSQLLKICLYLKISKERFFLCPKEVTCQLLTEELEILEQCVLRSKSPIVFCHNDLQEGNILLRRNSENANNLDLDKGNVNESLILIDFEYSGYNYRQISNAPYYSIDQQLFPDVEQQRILISSYLDEMHAHEESAKVFDSSSIIDELIIEMDRFTAVSHLFWSIWAFFLAQDSPIQFDYISYGMDRLALYYDKKSSLMQYMR